MGKKFSLTAPKATTTEAEFVAAADVQSYPWLDSRVREDLIKVLSLRLSEPDYLKLKFLSEKTHISQQKLIEQVLIPWLNDEVKKHAP